MSDPTSTLAQGLSGTYLLERPIGEGGMATVYLAQDLKHQRPVALKVLKPELAQNLGPERFRREITTAARLQHPHILSVHDSGETQGQFWFTMPFVDGESLRDRLKRERCLSIEDALRITREAAQALQYAHERGIVHRDIKPENILLTRDGSTLVADFGIARALGGDDGLTTTAENLTQTGAAIGTPQYMAPEQATGEKGVDARADQYALSAMLYEMLAGEPPFTASSAAALIAKRFTSSVPSVRTRRPEVPAAIDEAIQKALSLRADDRFGSVQEFARAATSLMAMSSADVRAISSASTPGLGTPAVTEIIAPRKSRTPVLVGVGVLALLAVGGVLLVRRAKGGDAPVATTATPAAATGAMRLAVLPFENLGDTSDAYFAEGIADELRGKLTGIPGLQVIARSSSVSYRGSTKPVQEIAKELGVRYVLTGTVRWEKAGGGKGRVRVSPELIEVGSAGAPESKWQQPFDAPITDVFQVQSDIAGKVASALNVALGAGEQQKLAEQPTQNLEAYQAFLQGEAISQGLSFNSPVPLRQALAQYQRAVTLDPTFALAWARVSQANSALYFVSHPTKENSEAALAAAQRALALPTHQANAHLALGEYYYFVTKEPKQAIVEFNKALQIDPRSPELLTAISPAEQSIGRYDSALQHLEQAKAIDPRNKDTMRRLARTLLWTRRYPEAAKAAAEALELAPTNTELVEIQAQIRIAQGDLAGAHAAIRSAPAEMPRDQLIADFGNYWDLYWVLEDADQQRLLQLGPETFDNNRGVWSIVRTQTHEVRGEHAAARAWADTAVAEYTRQTKAAPNDAQTWLIYALSLAYAGRGQEARAALDKGMALSPQDTGYDSAYFLTLQARVLMLTGALDEAVKPLEQAVSNPHYMSRAWLKVDPTYAPLRGNAAFQQLVSGS